MRTLSSLVVVCIITLASLLQSVGADSGPRPLTRAHSHNDYEHARPLLDALDQGFCSIEADIYLVNGHLLVAHNREDTKPERTLSALYLDPLRRRIQENQGRVFRGGPPVILLIDVKTEAAPTYAVLREVLLGYTNILSEFSGHSIKTQAVTVIISGNRSREMLAQEPVRYAALDGRPEDLSGGTPPDLIPLVSEDWKRLFRWRGQGAFDEEERRALRAMVQKAHDQGRKIRFWGTPDQPAMWRELLVAEVDLINADDLAGLRRFLTSRPGP